MNELNNDINKIAVVGLGYVGLPTAIAFYEQGFTIYGIDISEKNIKLLKGGNSPLIDETSDDKIPLPSERWNLSTNFEGVKNVDLVLITVPTPVNNDNTPDLSYIISASTSVMENLDEDSKTIIILESTVYPGVTRKELTKIAKQKGLEIGRNVEIAYCPERVNPGDSGHSVGSVSRVIGCDDKNLGEKIAEIYSLITSATSTYVGSIEVAEASKMVENLQRDIDIALVNELSIVLSRIGVDVEEVLAAAATKWNFHRHTPGIGIGGHCIPVDPYYYINLAEKVGYESILSKSARNINEKMPEHAAREIKAILGDDKIKESRILILGYSYKPELGDIRETPVKKLLELLHSENSSLLLWDPLVNKRDMPEFVQKLDDPYSEDKIDMVILATAHSKIIDLDWEKIGKLCTIKNIYDGRRVLEKNKFLELGWKFTGIGMPK